MLHCGRHYLNIAAMTGTPKRRRKESDTAAHSGKPLSSAKSKDARALRSARALQDALLSLLQRRSFDQITVRDICAEAEVHYATFFRHHQSKEELLDAIAKDQIAHLNQLTLAIRDTDTYLAGFRALCLYVDNHRDLWSILLNGGAGAAMREEWLRQAKMVAEAEKPANAWLPAELGTICASTLIAETLAWWVAQPRDAYDVEYIAQLLFRLISGAIIASDPSPQIDQSNPEDLG